MTNMIYAVLTQGWRVILAYFAWMIRFTKKGKRIPIEKKYPIAQKLVKHVTKGLKGDIHVYGKENIPNETVCFICNHINMSDPIIFIDVIDKPLTFVCKKEVKKMPFVNKIVSSLEGEFIDRENLKEGLRTMMRVEASLKERNKSWLIFAEGTRNRDPRSLLLPFHHGTFRAPTRAGVPLVPCCIYGTQRFISTKYNLKRYPIHIEFGKPIYPKEYEKMTNQEVSNEMMRRIQTMLSYHIRQKDKDELIYLLGDKYNENL